MADIVDEINTHTHKPLQRRNNRPDAHTKLLLLLFLLNIFFVDVPI